MKSVENIQTSFFLFQLNVLSQGTSFEDFSKEKRVYANIIFPPLRELDTAFSLEKLCCQNPPVNVGVHIMYNLGCWGDGVKTPDFSIERK